MRQCFESQPPSRSSPSSGSSCRPEPRPTAAHPGGPAMDLASSILRAQIFELLERVVLQARSDRPPGHGFVANPGFGVVRLGWKRTGPDGASGQLRCAPAPNARGPGRSWGASARTFQHQTLRDNVALLDEGCSMRSTPWSPPPGARSSKPKQTLRPRRWSSRWTPMFWKPTSISHRPEPPL